MLTAILAFFAGVLLAPIVRPLLRPLLVEAVKAGVMTAAEVRRLSAQVKEDMEDMAAKAEYEKRAGARRHEPTPAPPQRPPVRPEDGP